MNLVMQFRKVCNHPDLFERQIGRNPYTFRDLNVGVMAINTITNNPTVRSEFKNPITLTVPKLVFDECFIYSDNRSQTFTKLVPGEDIAFSQVSSETHYSFFNIFNAKHLHEQFFLPSSSFGILRLLAISNRWSVTELAYLCGADPLMQQLSLLHYYEEKHARKIYTFLNSEVNGEVQVSYHSSLPKGSDDAVDVAIIDFVKRSELQNMYREQPIVSRVDNSLDIIPPLVPEHVSDFMLYSGQLSSNVISQELKGFYVPICIATSVNLECPTSGTFNRFALAVKTNPVAKKILLGSTFKPTRFLQLGSCSNDHNSTAFVN